MKAREDPVQNTRVDPAQRVPGSAAPATMNETERRTSRIVCGAILVSLAAGCSNDKSTAAEDITGTTWEWTQTSTPTDRIEVSDPRRYTIRLKQNGEARIRYDCNHGGSLYEISEARLSLVPLTYTRVPCHEGSRYIMYRRQLAAVTTFYIEDGFLFLGFPNDAGTMRFRRKADDS